MNRENEINLIKRVIDGMRPYLQKDGGDISFVELTDDNVLKIKFSESCNDCKFKNHTRFIVEKQIRKYFPDLKEMLDVSE